MPTDPAPKAGAKAKRQKNQLADLTLGPLPVERINKSLDLELDPGAVVLTASHQVHASRRHPDDYARLLPHIASVIANPLYVGDDGRNPESFELIGRASVVAEMVLIAIKFEPDENGNYQVASFYPVSAARIQGRRERGFLHLVKP